MNAQERYLQEVLRRIPSALHQREPIEADLRAHMEEAMASGDPPETVLGRMGSPVVVAEELMAAIPLHPAGFWRRLAAFAVDVAIIIAAAAIPGLAAIALGNLVPRHPEGWELVLGGLVLLASLACALASVGVVLLYFPILEARFGRTIGKRLLGLWVVRETGLTIGYKEAFLRRLSFYFEILLVDALFIPFTLRRQRAFDIVARTLVIQL